MDQMGLLMIHIWC